MDIDTTHAYAVAVGGIFIACALLRLRSRFKACFDFVHRLTLHYLLYPRLIRRHRFIGPWSWAAVLVQLWFVAVNAFCVGFRASSIHDVSRRAARLSLLNLVPAYSGAHLSFLADVFGISLRTFRVIHRSAGVMAFFLLAFHVAITMATRTPFPLHTAENMWGLIVGILCTGLAAFASNIRLLTVCRAPLRCVFFSVCLFPYFVDLHTSCSFDCTNCSLSLLSLQSGAI